MNFYGGTFFSGGFFGGESAVVAQGAGKPKRRWQAEKDGQIYEFASAAEAQAFLFSLVPQQKLQRVKKAPQKFRLPDVEIFYDDIAVTNLEIESKPVIEWFYGPDLETLEAILADMEEDDIEVILLVS